jgi:hypothetical protein
LRDHRGLDRGLPTGRSRQGADQLGRAAGGDHGGHDLRDVHVPGGQQVGERRLRAAAVDEPVPTGRLHLGL